MVELQKQDSFYEIAKEINELGTMLATRLYVAIVDGAGVIKYIDAMLDAYKVFIETFVRENFSLLNIGDHSLPLGGVNLAFFKVSQKSMIVLYMVKGLSGQLLSFKARMYDWTNRIDGLIGEVALQPAIQPLDSVAEIEEPEVQPSQPKSKGVKTVPLLIKEIGKERFPLEVAQILQYCDGKHSTEEIAQITTYSQLKVESIIREYQKKKWVEIKRALK